MAHQTSETTTFDNTATGLTYDVLVNGERKGCVWYAQGAKGWGALVYVNVKPVPRGTPENTLEALLARIRKDFKRKDVVEFRMVQPKAIRVDTGATLSNYQACGYGCEVQRTGRTIPAPLFYHVVKGERLGHCGECNRNSKLN